MERNVSFQSDGVQNVRAKLTWAQIEIVSGPGTEFQLLIAGDDESVEEVRAEKAGEEIVLSQPHLAYAKELLPRRRWLQICLRVPEGWRGDLDVDTIAGMIGLHKVSASSLSLTTVAGAMRVNGAECDFLVLQSATGAITVEGVRAKRANLRTVSGKITFENATVYATKLFTVSGEVFLALRKECRTLDSQSVSGAISVTVDGPAKAVLRSLSGQFLVDEKVEQAEGGLEITASSVSGDLAVKARA